MPDVRSQYERFPYPPVPALALPRRRQGEALSFELGARLAGSPRTHAGIRILVAGAGTLEALVVAQAHPRAAEVVAVDLSETSLKRLARRTALWKVARFPSRLPRLRRVAADLTRWEPEGAFDFILASNVLHHVEDPAALLARLAGWLKPNGLMRIVTYPKQSRLWMRETSRWLTLTGLDPASPQLVSRARRAIQTLSESHPVRSCFESHPEASTPAGLVDAFLHALENPLSPLEWRDACDRAGLELFAETQAPSSRSSFVDEVFPEARALDPWSKLQVLDDLLELCANPILWLRRAQAPAPGRKVLAPRLGGPFDRAPGARLSARARQEIRDGLLRAEALLAPYGLSLATVFERIRSEVGPRYSPPPGERVLPGLSLADYELGEFVITPKE